MFEQAFAHRPKSNGSFDSICMKCFATAATGMTEEQLEVMEKKHTCNKENLAHMAEDVAA